MTDSKDEQPGDVPDMNAPIPRTAVVKEIERVFDGFLKIDKAVVSHDRYDGGRQTVTRLSMERGDAAAVILVDSNARTIWLTEQFRYPTLAKGEGEGWIEEIPAGMPEEGESMEDCARREIMEETGFEGLELEHVSTFFVSPGGTSERIWLYYADVSGKQRNEVKAKASQDAEEDIKLVAADLDGFLSATTTGRLEDAKTLIAGLWLAANSDRLGLS